MKDQKAILFKCLQNDIPAFVIAGTDACAIEAIKAYADVAIEKGCSSEFINDMVLVIREFEHFQTDEAEKVRIPD